MRSILITGGNGGLGLGIARYFLSHDTEAKVWLGVRKNRAQAEILSNESAGRCRMIDLEVTSPDAWRIAAEKIIVAERDSEKIAVEVKSFVSKSKLADWYEAYGQFSLYKKGLSKEIIMQI